MTIKELEFNGRKFIYTDSQICKDGKLYRKAAAGVFIDNTRVYRKMGNYNLYIWSFRNAALPYSRYIIADKRTGAVYTCEVLHGMSDEKGYITDLVAYFKEK